jgi:hypothetical protein
MITTQLQTIPNYKGLEMNRNAYLLYFANKREIGGCADFIFIQMKSKYSQNFAIGKQKTFVGSRNDKGHARNSGFLFFNYISKRVRRYLANGQ